MRRALLALVALLATAQAPGPPWCTSVPLHAGCRAVEVRAPRAALRLAVATTEEQRELGLMFVHTVPRGEGMLFVFPDGDGPREFWMKNTITPLDMIFVRGDGTVDGIAPDVPATTPETPDDRIPRRAGTGRFVIELRSGDAARAGIARGTRLALPAIAAQ